jgi:16S rRNA (guanine527-N7)-methyltransferase
VNNIELLTQGLKELDIHCSKKQLNMFMMYLTELKKWNRAYNLTGLKTDDDIIVKHFLDSLLYFRIIPDGTLKAADIGTGAGFPGLPIKIVRPEIEMTLIDSSRKKTAFLRNMVRALKLTGVHILEKRLENLGTDFKNTYDVIATRATFSIKEFLGSACPYVKTGGLLILNKGPKVWEEIKELDTAPEAKQQIRDVMRLTLPFTKAERHIVVLECKKSFQ